MNFKYKGMEINGLSVPHNLSMKIVARFMDPEEMKAFMEDYENNKKHHFRPIIFTDEEITRFVQLARGEVTVDEVAKEMGKHPKTVEGYVFKVLPQIVERISQGS